jgi:hypothetical protein
MLAVPAAAGANTTVTLDARNPNFLDTHVALAAGETVSITASGNGTCQAGNHYYACPGGPAGSGIKCANVGAGYGPGPAGANVPIGAVAAKVGSGTPFFVGHAGTATGPGELYVIYNDCIPPEGYADNAGSFTVTIGTPEYKIKMVGLMRPAAVGPLPSPIGPDKVAFGDTVDFALYGWDPHGGPITVSWGSRRLGRLEPDVSGNTPVGELKLDSFQTRGTLANNKPCAGALTATQGSHKRALDLKAIVRGVIILNHKTHSSLKADDVYCLGEIQTHPHEFAAAGGAIIYTTPDSQAPFPSNLTHQSSYVPVTIRDELTKIDVVAVASFRGHLCVRLGTNHWVVISIPLPGEIRTIDHAAPCQPNPVPHSLFIETFSPMNLQGVQFITTRTVSAEDILSATVFTESVLFSNKLRCNDLYGEGNMSFPAGLTGPSCFVVAQGSIEINGALPFETSDFSSAIDIIAGGDTILSGSGA